MRSSKGDKLSSFLTAYPFTNCCVSFTAEEGLVSFSFSVEVEPRRSDFKSNSLLTRSRAESFIEKCAYQTEYVISYKSLLLFLL